MLEIENIGEILSAKIKERVGAALSLDQAATQLYVSKVKSILDCNVDRVSK